MLDASKRASEERTARVTAPALVLMSSQDPDFKQPAAEAQWVAQALHTTYTMIDGAGHYPHAEFPEIAGGHILAFLNELTEKSD